MIYFYYMSIKKHLAIISHSNSGKVAEIRANLLKLGIAVPHDLRSHVALESIAIGVVDLAYFINLCRGF